LPSFFCEQGLHRSNTARHVEVLLKGPLDGPLRNDPEFWHTDLDFSGRHSGIFNDLPLQHPFQHVVDFFGPSRALFSVGNLVFRKNLCFREEAVDGRPVLPQPLSDFQVTIIPPPSGPEYAPSPLISASQVSKQLLQAPFPKIGENAFFEIFLQFLPQLSRPN
jgi:hypothetical protein